MSRAPGALAIVLHTHMPYVEGFGTWPFGEEWLWEAVAACYLPLLDALDAAPGRVTLSVTPVLGDQLEAPGALERCAAFLRESGPSRTGSTSPPRAIRGEAAALEHSAAALRARRRRARGDLPARLAAHATLDLGGHARGAAAARDARRRAAAARDRDRRAPRALRAAGPAASGCPSARTRRGSTSCSRRRACAPPAST